MEAIEQLIQDLKGGCSLWRGSSANDDSDSYYNGNIAFHSVIEGEECHATLKIEAEQMREFIKDNDHAEAFKQWRNCNAD